MKRYAEFSATHSDVGTMSRCPAPKNKPPLTGTFFASLRRSASMLCGTRSSPLRSQASFSMALMSSPWCVLLCSESWA